MWLVYMWLSDVYMDGLMGVVLMFVMFKFGGYGFLCFVLLIMLDVSYFFVLVVIVLLLFVIVYVSFVVFVQIDFGKLFVYLMVVYMGIVMFGLFLFNWIGVEGVIVQFVLYGFVVGVMLLCVNVFVDCIKQCEIVVYGGVVGVMLCFVIFMLLFVMVNVGLLGMLGFVGEFMVIMGVICFNFWIGVIVVFMLIFSVLYMLWMFKCVVFGKVVSQWIVKFVDLNCCEIVMFVLFVLIVFVVGIDLKLFIDVIDLIVGRLIQEVSYLKVLVGDGFMLVLLLYMVLMYD